MTRQTKFLELIYYWYRVLNGIFLQNSLFGWPQRLSKGTFPFLGRILPTFVFLDRLGILVGQLTVLCSCSTFLSIPFPGMRRQLGVCRRFVLFGLKALVCSPIFERFPTHTRLAVGQNTEFTCKFAPNFVGS
jgi:hypothetical protein